MKSTCILLFFAVFVMAATCDMGVKEGEKCRPVDGNEKEQPGTIRYLEDQTRSFGKPGSTLSHSAMKKTCQIDSHDAARIPRDCADVQAAGESISGIYSIRPLGLDNPFNVYCDMQTEGGGWTIIQRRRDPWNSHSPLNFHRNLTSYKEGFGSVSGEYWLGNEKLHYLTHQGTYKLRVHMDLLGDKTIYAEYGRFSIGNESSEYSLRISNHSGSAADYMSFLSGEPFAISGWPKYCRGGWWRDPSTCIPLSFPNGGTSNENKDWYKVISYFGWSVQGVNAWSDAIYAKSSEMKIRPA